MTEKKEKYRKTLNRKPEGNGPFANPCLNFILTMKLPFSFPLCCLQLPDTFQCTEALFPRRPL